MNIAVVALLIENPQISGLWKKCARREKVQYDVHVQ